MLFWIAYQGAEIAIQAGGDVALRAIDTRDRTGSGNVTVNAGGQIALQSYGAIRTSARPDGNGAAGDVTLTAGGDVTLGERFLVQAWAYGGGAGGDIDITGRSLTLNNRTQLDTSTRGAADGGDINVAVTDALTLRGTNTRILSLVEPGAVGDGGDITLKAGSLAVTNGAGIYSGVRGQGNGGWIDVEVTGPMVLDGRGGGSASAVVSTVFANGQGDAGDIDLKAGSLSLVDGGLISSQLASDAAGNAGLVMVDVTGDVVIEGQAVDKTLPDTDFDLPPVSGKVDVFFLADNTRSMRGVINRVKASSSEVLSRLSGADPRFEEVDIATGAGRYVFEEDVPTPPSYAYSLLQPIDADADATQVALQEWSANNPGAPASAGDDESNFFALHQVATSGGPTDGMGVAFDQGIGTGLQTGWRDGADRVIIWLGDEPARAQRVDFAEVTAALVTNDVAVAAINTERAGSGIDAGGQASAIAFATGGSLANNINTAGVADLILNAVDEALFPDYALVDSSGINRPQSNAADPPSGIYLGGNASSTGTGGNLNLTAANLRIADTALINNPAPGSGNGGNLTFTIIGNTDLDRRSRILSTTFSPSNAGSITLNTDQMTVQDGSEIASFTGTEASPNGQGGDASGRGGDIAITATGDIRVQDKSAIASSSLGFLAGPPGSLTLSANNLTLQNRSGLTTNSLSSSDAGPLNVTVNEEIAVSDISQISSQTLSSGAGGNMQLTGKRLRVERDSEVTSASLINGRAGNLSVNMTESVAVKDRSTISAFAFQQAGAAGDITIDTAQFSATGGGRVEASTGGAGAAGNVIVRASDSINLEGVAEISFEESRSITATNPIVAEIYADFEGVLDALELLSEDPEIIAAYEAQGLGFLFEGIEQYRGALDNFSDDIALLRSGIASNNVAEALGDAANIAITTGNLNIANGAEVTTAALGDGNGGDISAISNNITLSNTGQILSRTEGAGRAGSVSLQADNALTLTGGEISSRSAAAGGGNLSITADRTFLNSGSLLSSSVADSTGGGGDITIDSDVFVAIDDSDILANANAGPGGNISINSETFLAALFVGGKATPVGRNPGPFARFRGNRRVDISADSLTGLAGFVSFPNVDPARGTTPLPEALPDRADQIDRSCQVSGDAAGRSKFVVTGRQGLPLMPSEPMDRVQVQSGWVSLPEAAKITVAQQRTSAAELARTTATATPLEASRWTYNAQGDVILAAERPTRLEATDCALKMAEASRARRSQEWSQQ